MLMRLLLTWLTAIVLITACTETAAHEAFESGNIHFDKGELDQAIADFREVFRISKDPTLRQFGEEQLELLGASP